MHLVAFSTDRKILSGETPLQIAYASHFDSYTIVVGSKGLRAAGRRTFAHNAQAIGLTWKVLFSREFWRIVKRTDIISSQDPFEAGLFALVIALLLRKPLHLQIHTDLFSAEFAQVHRGNFWRQKVARYVLARAARIRVVSQKLKGKLVATGVRVPVTVLPIFVDLSRFKDLARTKHPRFKINLLMLGRLEAEKRFEEGIQALALLRAHGHDAGLTIVGSGRQHAHLVAEARKHKVDGFVEMVGQTSDVVPYLARAEVLLVPSAYEGYGLVIIEALASGVPVISTDVGIAKEMGAIIAPHEDFAATVLSWASSGPRRGELHSYPYANQKEYVDAWVADVHATAQPRSM
ncbi:MAG: glycosyltransferase [Candidatus Pacebacteria bacterium]|nr:glycosyltransferase [Candidatus Paceibacterota bacterium]